MTDAKAAEPEHSPRTRRPAGSAPVVNPLVYRGVVGVTYLPLLLRGAHLDVHGRELVPPAGTPLIVAANHRHALDPFLMARALPPQSGRHLQFMAKRELFVPVVGDIIRAGGSFPVDRDGQDVGAVRTSLRILQAGGTLGIFPEGTRAGGELHGGVALIALKSRAPVLPAGLWHNGRRWVIRFGELLPASLGSRGLIAALGEQLHELSQPYGTWWA